MLYIDLCIYLFIKIKLIAIMGQGLIVHAVYTSAVYQRRTAAVARVRDLTKKEGPPEFHENFIL